MTRILSAAAWLERATRVLDDERLPAAFLGGALAMHLIGYDPRPIAVVVEVPVAAPYPVVEPCVWAGTVTTYDGDATHGTVWECLEFDDCERVGGAAAVRLNADTDED